MQDQLQVGRRHQRGSAAAEEDGMRWQGRAGLLLPGRADLGDLAGQRDGIGVLQIAEARVGVEVAVGAAVAAEGNVQIKTYCVWDHRSCARRQHILSLPHRQWVRARAHIACDRLPLATRSLVLT